MLNCFKQIKNLVNVCSISTGLQISTLPYRACLFSRKARTFSSARSSTHAICGVQGMQLDAAAFTCTLFKCVHKMQASLCV